MTYAIRLYNDQLSADQLDAEELSEAHRLIYVRSGSVRINDAEYCKDDVFACSSTLQVSAADEQSEIWRWELVPINDQPRLLSQMGCCSHLLMTSPLTTLNLFEGDTWLFRLDRMMFPAGYVVPCHHNAGPGIRCVQQGSFSFHEGTHGKQEMLPGTPFFESGAEPCMAWGSIQMSSGFVRSMVLDRSHEGKMVTSFPDRSKLKPGPEWTLLCDLEVLLKALPQQYRGQRVNWCPSKTLSEAVHS